MEVLNENEISVGWNSTPPPPPLRSFFSTTTSVATEENPNPQPQFNRSQFAPEEGKKKDTSCFYCKQDGHWVKDCPLKSSPKRPPTQPPSSDDVPILHCECGVLCVVRASKKPWTFGRKFYTCPFSSARSCDFFKWFNDGTRGVNIVTPTHPICGCGAGPCRIYKENSGPDAGRRFFVCPIKKGQGACKFSQPVDPTNKVLEEQLLDSPIDLLELDASMDLLDEHLLDIPTDVWDGSLSSPDSALTNCDDSSPSSRDLVEEGDSSHHGTEIELPVVDTPEHPRKLGTSNDLSMEESSGRKPCKRLRHGDPKIDSFINDASSDCWYMPQSTSMDPTTEKALRPSILTSGALTRRRQVKFLRQISSAGASLPEVSSSQSSSVSCTSRELLTENCLDMASICHILGFNFNGWYGRLAFPPARSLKIPAPRPFFCGVFPCFDPISLPQDVDLPIERLGHALVDSSTPFVPSGALLCEPSGLKPPPKNFRGKIMEGSVLEKFKQAAVSLQDELLTLLESMDIHDHVSMLEESFSVFDALERLSVDYEHFKEQVKEYIGHAASLAEVESSIHTDDRSSQELLDCYNHKKLQLEDISRCHAETSSALEASNEHLQHLQNEASRLKEMLLRVEEELACRKVENIEIDVRFNLISEDKLQSELNLQDIFKEAEEAEKAYQRREAERNVAKASFEKARSQLRQSCNTAFLM